MMNKPNYKDISSKNTKNEILEAYQGLIEKTREIYKKSRQQDQELETQRQLIEQANQQTPSSVQENLLSLREKVNQQLTDIAQQFESQIQSLDIVQKSIVLEEKSLEEVYEIKKTAHTLDTLLLAHRQEKDNFEEEISERKVQWKRDQETFKRMLGEEQSDLRKTWEREKEEYQYCIEHERKQEEDAYLFKKNQLDFELQQNKDQVEKTLQEKETILLEREKTLTSLEEEVKVFPEKLCEAVSVAEQRVTESLEREHAFRFDLLAKEREGEQKLSSEIIAGLEGKIRSQEDLIKQLTEKANHSMTQVKDIALKAIEGAAKVPSKSFYYPSQQRPPVETTEV